MFPGKMVSRGLESSTGCAQQVVQNSLGSSKMQKLSSVETQESAVVGMRIYFRTEAEAGGGEASFGTWAARKMKVV